MSEAMAFTGERFTPECVREIWYEHWHRYAFAQRFAVGKRVLDVACGEGYGSHLLASVARSVLGLDISEAAIEHARRRYGGVGNLRFDIADATSLVLPTGAFDVITSFETLEHVQAHDELLDGLSRSLADDGVLLISSPDKYTYSDVTGHHNEFHVRELYRHEFESLLRRFFPFVHVYGQKLLFHSAIWSADKGPVHGVDSWTADQQAESLDAGIAHPPLYFIAVCSRQPLTGLPELSLFDDREESVYTHYNHEILKNMAAGARIAELEAEVERLQAALSANFPVSRSTTD